MNANSPARMLRLARRTAWMLALAWGALYVADVANGADAAVANANANANASPHTVAIDGVAYQPAALTVHRGDVVVWTNKDPFPHTVTAAGSFDSKSIAAGASWRYKAAKAGTYDYICTLHPNMKGTLKVE